MRIQLSPRSSVAYGQDAVVQSTRDRLGLTPCYWDANGYSIPVPVESIELVVSHNPDDHRDADFISSLPDNVSVVIHTHLQWEYLFPEIRDNFIKSVGRAHLGITPATFATQSMADRFGHVRWETVYNGIDPSRFKPTSLDERTTFRRERGIPLGDQLVIYVGRLEDAKGQQVLVNMAGNLPPGVTLAVQFLSNTNSSKVRRYAPLADSIKQANPDKVILIPDKDLQADRPVRYADVLVSPSLMELAPLVVVEALMSGLPVVTTNSTPFLTELGELGVCGDELRIVTLPDYIHSLPQDMLRLTGAEAAGVAAAMKSGLEAIKSNADLYGDACRKERGNRVRGMGLGLDDMISSYAKLYSTLTTASE